VLTELRVRDLAVIADVTLPLTSGLNVLTGETGAGKSMLVDALSLLLGERASTDIVRPGARRAVVEAAFDVAGSAGITAVADDLGVDVEEDRLIVRREINVEGRNRAWVNGSPTTVAALATLGRMMVDLHGQHEAQSLLRPAAQRDILDAFGEAGDERARVEAAFDAAARLREEERDLVARRDDVLKRADYLRHVVQEIEQAKPRPGEDEALSVEGKRLANVEELTRLAERLMELLEGAEEGAALQTLGQASKTLMQLERVDDSVERWRELLEAASANLEELALALREYAADIDVDPERLQEVERRRDLLYRLTQKYGSTIDAVLATGDEARQELDLLDTAHLDLDQLSERRAAAEVELQAATDALTAKRRKAAGRLAKAVEALLPGLGMPSGKFAVEVGPASPVTAAGADAVTFMVQLNPGLDARPIAQVASGGELSRLMLALKVVLAAHDAVPSLVFDEVDQGIGGEVALQVGEALARVAGSRQVLVITHLPQIAARATHHVSVAKRPKKGIATADVTVQLGDDRVQEIARMLGDAGARMLGDAGDRVVVQHAQELLRKTRVAAAR
jgi:DNA repair protein RecN (Recombination protein N)